MASGSVATSASGLSAARAAASARGDRAIPGGGIAAIGAGKIDDQQADIAGPRSMAVKVRRHLLDMPQIKVW